MNLETIRNITKNYLHVKTIVRDNHWNGKSIHIYFVGTEKLIIDDDTDLTLDDIKIELWRSSRSMEYEYKLRYSDLETAKKFSRAHFPSKEVYKYNYLV